MRALALATAVFAVFASATLVEATEPVKAPVRPITLTNTHLDQVVAGAGRGGDISIGAARAGLGGNDYAVKAVGTGGIAAGTGGFGEVR
jgi:hypothetical protein